MKIGDKVYNEYLGKVGVITRDAYYMTPNKTKNKYGIMELAYHVKFSGEYKETKCLASDLHLAEIPISMKSDCYWGMIGIILKADYGSALVKLYGYKTPLRFKASEIEPLREGSILEHWLDTLLSVKEY